MFHAAAASNSQKSNPRREYIFSGASVLAISQFQAHTPIIFSFLTPLFGYFLCKSVVFEPVGGAKRVRGHQ
jgi:hypothetical protein